VATRLTNRIYAVLKEGRPYVLRDLEARPITVTQGKELVLRDFEVPTSVRQRREEGVSLCRVTDLDNGKKITRAMTRWRNKVRTLAC